MFLFSFNPMWSKVSRTRNKSPLSRGHFCITWLTNRLVFFHLCMSLWVFRGLADCSSVTPLLVISALVWKKKNFGSVSLHRFDWEYRNRNPNRFGKYYRNIYRSTYRGPALDLLMCPHKFICLYETWKRLWVIWDTILLQGWVHASWTCGVRNVVTRSLSRILLVYVTCRHMWTKLEVIQTSVFFSDSPTRIPYFHYKSTCDWRVEQFWK